MKHAAAVKATVMLLSLSLVGYFHIDHGWVAFALGWLAGSLAERIIVAR